MTYRRIDHRIVGCSEPQTVRRLQAGLILFNKPVCALARRPTRPAEAPSSSHHIYRSKSALRRAKPLLGWDRQEASATMVGVLGLGGHRMITPQYRGCRNGCWIRHQLSSQREIGQSVAERRLRASFLQASIRQLGQLRQLTMSGWAATPHPEPSRFAQRAPSPLSVAGVLRRCRGPHRSLARLAERSRHPDIARSRPRRAQHRIGEVLIATPASDRTRSAPGEIPDRRS